MDGASGEIEPENGCGASRQPAPWVPRDNHMTSGNAKRKIHVRITLLGTVESLKSSTLVAWRVMLEQYSIMATTFSNLSDEIGGRVLQSLLQPIRIVGECI